MVWSLPRRELPSIPVATAEDMEEAPEARSAPIPWVPITILGKKAMLASLSFVCFGGPVTGYEDGSVYGKIRRLVQEMEPLVAGSAMQIEYHKLDYEDIGYAVHFAQHCGSVRPAFALRATETKHLGIAVNKSSQINFRCGVSIFLFRSSGVFREPPVEFLGEKHKYPMSEAHAIR